MTFNKFTSNNHLKKCTVHTFTSLCGRAIQIMLEIDEIFKQKFLTLHQKKHEFFNINM